MPIVSAVLTLSPDPALRAQTLAELAELPALTAATAHKDRLPVVVDTPDRGEDRAAWTMIESLPGVLHIELVFADFSDLRAPAAHPVESTV